MTMIPEIRIYLCITTKIPIVAAVITKAPASIDSVQTFAAALVMKARTAAVARPETVAMKYSLCSVLPHSFWRNSKHFMNVYSAFCKTTVSPICSE